jgi:hypothetical protein
MDIFQVHVIKDLFDHLNSLVFRKASTVRKSLAVILCRRFQITSSEVRRIWLRLKDAKYHRGEDLSKTQFIDVLGASTVTCIQYFTSRLRAKRLQKRFYHAIMYTRDALPYDCVWLVAQHLND